MAQTYTNIIILDNSPDTATIQMLTQKAGSPKEETNQLVNYLMSFVAGSRAGKYYVQTYNKDGVAASGTLTLASVVATNTCAVNGVTFTCVASAPTNVQFVKGGTDTVTAANLAAAINASTNPALLGSVAATSTGAVVTVTAIEPGLSGNGYTLTAGTNFTRSGANLTSGTTDTGPVNLYHVGI